MRDAAKSGSKALPTTTPEAIVSDWYFASFAHGHFTLEAHPVSRSTAKFVWVNWRNNGRFEQRSKVSDYGRYFANYDDAANYIKDQFAAAIARRKKELEAMNKEFSRFYAMWEEGQCTS